MFSFLSMFLNNVEKNGKNIYSYIYTFKKIVFYLLLIEELLTIIIQK